MARSGDVVTLRSQGGDQDTNDFDLGSDDKRHRDARMAVQPAVVAAQAMLRDALGNRLSEEAARTRFLILAVPDTHWTGPVIHAFRLHAKGGRPAERLGLVGVGPLDRNDWVHIPADGARAGILRDEAGTVLLAGGQLVVTTSSPDALPAPVRAAADRVAVLERMDWAILRHVAEAVCGPCDGWPVEPRPPQDVLDAIGPGTLALSVRPGDDARSYAGRVLRIAAAADPASRPPPGPGTIPVRRAAPHGLARVPGLGPALDWARALAADLREYRAGRIAWADVDRGAVLVGPPGTGKTSFARALAEECGVPLVAASYGEWQAAGHQGEMIKAMRASFAAARAQAPCLLFIDELDSFPVRGQQGQNHESYVRQVVNALLAELDGLEGREGVVVVAACNEVDGVDPAILRAGRLDRVISVGLPDVRGRQEILRVHLGDDLPGADLMQVATLADGMSGAEIEKVVREARRAARVDGRRMLMGDLVVAVAEALDLELMPCTPSASH